MALREFHCIECNKKFQQGDWDCVPGQKHTVESKRYYMADAPTVPEWRDGFPYINKGASQTQVLNIPPERQIKVGEDIHRIPGGTVTFVRGLFETNDPEIQFYLDKKAGLVTEERWKEVYLNDDEKNHIKNMELQAREARLAERENELLASQKAKRQTA